MSDFAQIKAEFDKTMADFKAANDQALAEAQASGKASAETAAKVDKINSAIDGFQDQLKAMSANFGDKLAALNVGAGSGINAADREKQARIFSAACGKTVTPEQVDAYNKAFGNFLRKGEINNAMSVGDSQSGGLLVGPATEAATAMKIYETSPLRQLANVITISGASNAIEGLVDNDEATTAWASETTAPSETTTPKLGKYRIETFTQIAEPRITQQLIDDAAVNVEAWLAAKVADKFARTENTAFISGNGSGKPRGFLDYTIVSTADSSRAWDNIQYVASGASGAFASSNPADALVDIITELKPAYRQGAVFMAARRTIGAIRKLKDGQGNYLVGNTLSQGAFVETIFGFPVIVAEDMPAIAANSYSLAFGNFQAAYTIVDKQGITVMRDPFTAKPYVKFYTTKRVGGGLVNGEALKLMKFAAS